jgi:hypothetical protein
MPFFFTNLVFFFKHNLESNIILLCSIFYDSHSERALLVLFLKIIVRHSILKILYVKLFIHWLNLLHFLTPKYCFFSSSHIYSIGLENNSFMNPNVHCYVSKRPKFDPIFVQLNPPLRTIFFSNINFNIILLFMDRLPSGHFLWDFLTKIVCVISHAWYSFHPSPELNHSSSRPFRWRVQIIELNT